jgi:MraZ protein
MLAGAMDVKLDNQGRILVPDYLRKYAGLGKKVVLAGVYNRLEVWDEKEWTKYKQRTEKESGNIAERLGDLGI